MPVGVVEVKTPTDRDVFQAGHVVGQLFDYMLRLRSFHGLKHVFGILTTYERWRFFWMPTPGTNIYAGLTQVSSYSTQLK